MSDEIRFLPASSFALDALANIFTRSFAEYFYTGTTTPEILAARVRFEQIDLHRSLVMLVGDEPAGQALLCLRGDRAWCGGFGVMVPFRGRGLSRGLAAELVAQARQAGARSFSLEVLTRNERAIKTYAGAGLEVRRDLLVLEWQQENEEQRTENEEQRREESGVGDSEEQRTENEEQRREESGAGDGVVEEAPGRLLERFGALHAMPAAWQRDLPALLVRGGMQGLAIREGDLPLAYLLFQPNPDGSLRLLDLGAERVEQVSALLRALQARCSRIIDINEPAASPFIAAFAEAGFVEVDRQHEMAIELAREA